MSEYLTGLKGNETCSYALFFPMLFAFRGYFCDWRLERKKKGKCDDQGKKKTGRLPLKIAPTGKLNILLSGIQGPPLLACVTSSLKLTGCWMSGVAKWSSTSWPQE